MRDYYNQKYHDKLDWRLGLDLAQIAADSSFVPSIMDECGYWYKLILSRIDALKAQGNDKISSIQKPETFIITINNETVILAHPFWSKRKISELKNKYSCQRFVYINTFIQSLNVTALIMQLLFVNRTLVLQTISADCFLIFEREKRLLPCDFYINVV